jgi:hypothetical protein
MLINVGIFFVLNPNPLFQMTHKPHFKFCCHGLATSLLGMTLAMAAPITWSSAPYTVSGSFGQTLNTGLFVTTGTQILAENIGGGATTFDGINFTAGTISMGSGAASVFHEAMPTANTPLARDGSYGSNVPSTVTLSGLTSGNIYRVQALVYDGRGGLGGRTVKFDGINQGVYANGVAGATWGNGLLVTGTFTADATTQAFTIEAFVGATSKGGQLNALLVHEFIPGTPALANPTVATITSTGAQAGVNLSSVAANVTLHWATTDQDLGPWDNSNPLGVQAIGPVSGALTGLAGDTQYFYRFHAVNAAADPDTETWSIAGTSFATALTGKAPTDPAATTYSKAEIDVTWTDGFATETGFVIQRSPDGQAPWTQVGTTAADTQIFYDSNLLPGTTYHYRVFAQNEAGLSDPSAAVSATTTAPDPGIVVQAWFRMGDSAAPGLNNLPTDSSTNTRDFTVKNGATDTTISPTGGGYNNDAYYTFNGVDQSYNSIGYDPPENNVGVEVWVRTSNLAQINANVFGTGTNANGLNIAYEAAGARGWSGAVANQAWVGDGVGTANYTANTWIHLALVRDNGTTTFYVNGLASGTSAATPLNATQPRMAATFNNGIFFSGDVAEARIFTFDPGQFNVSDLLYPGTPPPSDPYLVWATGLGDPGVNVDFDGGGLATGIEWVTGGDPAVGSDDPSVTPSFNNTSDPGNFLFTFRRRDAAASDTGTVIVVEYGSNLTGWRNNVDHGVADGVTVDASTDLGGGFHQVTVSIPRSLASGGKLFARLKVTRP